MHPNIFNGTALGLRCLSMYRKFMVEWDLQSKLNGQAFYVRCGHI